MPPTIARPSAGPGARRALALIVIVSALCTAAARPALAQDARSGAPDIDAHIAALSSLDYPTRMNAARAIRRVDATVAVKALKSAIASHPDEYVRYRAFVLLTSFEDPGTRQIARDVLKDRNDRLRETGYKWLERHPDPSMAATLLAALRTEQAEFVRPALVAALAALGSDPQVQRALIQDTARGVDFFRGAVIDALGRHDGAYAIDAISAVANLEGPLQDDAVLALGRIGGARALAALGAVKSASPAITLTIRAARCIAGEACDSAVPALADAIASPPSTAVARGASQALSIVAAEGRPGAVDALVRLGERGAGVRDQAALSLAAAAVLAPDRMLAWLDAAAEPQRAVAIELLKTGFDDLEEDFAEEQFFAATRASYWKSPEGSAGRTLAATVIQKLEF